jgi:hypothetical protein
MMKVSARAEAFFVYRKGRVAERVWVDPVKDKKFVFVADPGGLPLKFESFKASTYWILLKLEKGEAL